MANQTVQIVIKALDKTKSGFGRLLPDSRASLARS